MGASWLEIGKKMRRGERDRFGIDGLGLDFNPALQIQCSSSIATDLNRLYNIFHLQQHKLKKKKKTVFRFGFFHNKS